MEVGGENVYEKVWINILINLLYMCFEWFYKILLVENEIEIVDIIKVVFENVCFLEKIVVNEIDDWDEYRQRVMECEKFVIDIVE